MSLGETIYRLRTEHHMSQGDLAAALDVSRQSISKWETDSSVPELDKLIKLSAVFGVSMDELILGTQPEKPPESTQPEPTPPQVQVVKSDGPSRKTVALVLFSLGVVIWLVVALLGDFLAGLVFASPFLLCGGICLMFRRNTGLWCAWALLCCVNVFLRWATGISWRLVLWTLNYDPHMNYIRLLFAWLELMAFVVMIAVTVLRFRKNPLPATKRTLGLLAAGWALFALSFVPISFDPLSVSGNLYYILSDWVKLILLTVLLTQTVRVIRSRK